jgi:hypothetical protein
MMTGKSATFFLIDELKNYRNGCGGKNAEEKKNHWFIGLMFLF